MGTWRDCLSSCPSCGIDVEVRLLDGIDTGRVPWAREAILERTLHQFRCDGCGQKLDVETSNVYTDFPRGHYIALEPEGGDWRALSQQHRQAFDQAFLFGPPVAREIGRSLVHRLVFGLEALREKLVIWDAGLDDRVVETLKATALEGAVGQRLRLLTVLSGGHLLFRRFLSDGERGQLTIPASEVNRHQGRRLSWMTDDWYVDASLAP